MNFLRHVLFVFQHRLFGGSRVSLGAYIKGHRHIRLGLRCKIHHAASVDATGGKEVRFGDAVTLNRYAYVQGGHGSVVLGNRVELNNFAIVNGTGGVAIGDDTIVGPGARIISYQHTYAKGATIRSQPLVAKPIRIGRDVWVGANAVIMAGVTVGEGAVIAAGAVVNRDVPPWALVAGVPAVVKKMRTAPAETA